MASTYDIGDVVRVSSTFTSTGGTAADPTAVYFAVKVPTLGVTTSTYSTGSTSITKAGTGQYYMDVPTTGSGAYHVRSWSTGSITAAAETYFYVRQQRVVST